MNTSEKYAIMCNPLNSKPVGSSDIVVIEAMMNITKIRNKGMHIAAKNNASCLTDLFKSSNSF